MLTTTIQILRVILLAACIGFVVSLMPTPYQKYPIQGCESPEESYDLRINPFVIVAQRVGCFIHANEKDITALSTAVIGLFTIMLGFGTLSLAWSTRRAADAAVINAIAAKQAAEAALAIELPVIRVGAPRLIGLDHLVPEIGPWWGGRVVRLLPDTFNTVPDLKISNYGRTNAVLHTIRVGWSFEKKI